MPQLIKNTQKTVEFINGRHAKESIDRKYENIVHNLNYFMTSLIVWKLSHFFIRDTLSFCFPNSKYLLRSKPKHFTLKLRFTGRDIQGQRLKAILWQICTNVK